MNRPKSPPVTPARDLESVIAAALAAQPVAAVMRRVMLWCVEAYVGHPGGQIDGPVRAD